jgi:hypothetical protein
MHSSKNELEEFVDFLQPLSLTACVLNKIVTLSEIATLQKRLHHSPFTRSNSLKDVEQSDASFSPVVRRTHTPIKNKSAAKCLLEQLAQDDGSDDDIGVNETDLMGSQQNACVTTYHPAELTGPSDTEEESSDCVNMISNTSKQSVYISMSAMLTTTDVIVISDTEEEAETPPSDVENISRSCSPLVTHHKQLKTHSNRGKMVQSDSLNPNTDNVNNMRSPSPSLYPSSQLSGSPCRLDHGYALDWGNTKSDSENIYKHSRIIGTGSLPLLEAEYPENGRIKRRPHVRMGSASLPVLESEYSHKSITKTQPPCTGTASLPLSESDFFNFKNMNDNNHGRSNILCADSSSLFSLNEKGCESRVEEIIVISDDDDESCLGKVSKTMSGAFFDQREGVLEGIEMRTKFFQGPDSKLLSETPPRITKRAGSSISPSQHKSTKGSPVANATPKRFKCRSKAYDVKKLLERRGSLKKGLEDRIAHAQCQWENGLYMQMKLLE